MLTQIQTSVAPVGAPPSMNFDPSLFLEKDQPSLPWLTALGRELFAARVAAPYFLARSLDVLAASAGLDSHQHAALVTALNPRLRVVLISGSAGSGKTRVLAAIVEAARRERKRVIVTAFTGKAVANARFALEKAGAPMVAVGTLHWFGFAGDKVKPTDADIVIVDEASLLSVELLNGVLRAMRPTARLVLIGDELQLPPVRGTGQPFLDARRMKLPHVQLRGVHRNRDQPGVHAFVTAMRTAATLPSPIPDGVRLIARPNGSLRGPLVGAWLAGRRRGATPQCIAWRNDRCELVNRWVQDVAGTRANEAVFSYAMTGGPISVHVGDRVVVTENQPGLSAHNGLVGVLEGVTYYGRDRRRFRIRDELTGRVAVVKRAPEHVVRLGYCLTAHKAQGSGWDHVIVFVPEALTVSDPGLWHYTAVTRARARLDVLTGLSAHAYWLDATERLPARVLRERMVVFRAVRDHRFPPTDGSSGLAVAKAVTV